MKSFNWLLTNPLVSKLLQTNYSFANHIYLIYTYEQDLALNIPEGLICCKRQTQLTSSASPFSTSVGQILIWLSFLFGFLFKYVNVCVCVSIYINVSIIYNLPRQFSIKEKNMSTNKTAVDFQSTLRQTSQFFPLKVN